ncbi:hypothetical protein [uncultured Pseudomonas sp.]|uniref:hypothetical protein n=1 Tax=uncultured Pseudomonas sp. TaxID=114707 RepID=UPI0025E19145|nr:hypothetical protein [uncultured Pseudomonas sp.]
MHSDEQRGGQPGAEDDSVAGQDQPPEKPDKDAGHDGPHPSQYPNSLPPSHYADEDE